MSSVGSGGFDRLVRVSKQITLKAAESIELSNLNLTVDTSAATLKYTSTVDLPSALELQLDNLSTISGIFDIPLINVSISGSLTTTGHAKNYQGLDVSTILPTVEYYENTGMVRIDQNNTSYTVANFTAGTNGVTSNIASFNASSFSTDCDVVDISGASILCNITNSGTVSYTVSATKSLSSASWGSGYPLSDAADINSNMYIFLNNVYLNIPEIIATVTVSAYGYA